jgi:glyoxylase-like metal-dependent hydrolase (beta-lactamase superfamily II)
MRVCSLQRLVPLVVVGLMGFAAGPEPSAQQPGQDGPRTQIVLLGTGTPAADPERFGPATAIVVNDTAYLVDAGAGIVRRAAAARDHSIKALQATNLGMVFLTHLHSDHTVGLPDLIFSPWTLV